MLLKKLTGFVVVLFMLVSCGMAQKQGVEIFATIKTDSLLDANNNLTPAGNLMIEKIAATMNLDSNSCLHIKQSCIHESDTVCFAKLKTLVNALVMRVPAEHISVYVTEPVHLNCEDCFEFYLTECPKTSSGNGSHIKIIKADTDIVDTPTVLTTIDNIDTVGIKILTLLSENRRIARCCKDTLMVLNNPYRIVYFIDTTEVHGINKNYYGDNFCIITQEKDLPMYNRYQVLLVSYFRHGNYFADVSLMNRVRKKIIAVDCELKGDGAGNWKVHRIKIKKGKPRK